MTRIKDPATIVSQVTVYVIKQDTGFASYFLMSWGEKTESFGALLRDAHVFPTMQAALDVMNQVANRWRLRGGQAIIPLAVVPANTNSVAALKVVTRRSQYVRIFK